MSRPDSLRRSLPGFGRFLRAFGPHVRRQRGVAGGAFALLLVEVLFRILEPWPLKFVVDGVLTKGAGAAPLPELVAEWSTLQVLAAAALAVVTFAALRALCAYGSTIGFALVGNRVLNDVRNELYRHLQRLSLRYHAKARDGDLVVRVVGDVGMLKEVVVTAFLPLLGNILIGLGMALVMLWLNWSLGLVVVAMLPVYLLVMQRKSRRIRVVARGQRKREGALATAAAESIGGIRVVQALGLGRAFAEAFESRASESLKDGVRVKRLSAGLERSVDVLIAVTTAIVLLLGSWLVLAGDLSVGGLLVFLSYLKGTFKPVRNFAKFSGRIAKASAAAERVLEVLDQEPDIVDAEGAYAAPRLAGSVRFEGVSFSYEDGLATLDAVDLDVEAGETIALVGPSGSGKSTLASLLLRLYDPTGGRITVDGTDIRDWTVESLRQQISVVLQDTTLFAGTVAENIAHGEAGVSRAAIEEAARRAQADPFVRDLADGYETLVGERGVTLSSGQRQRIAIARAIVRDAPIVILDEPTTGLDRANAGAVAAALADLCRDRTTLLITHDPALVGLADRVVHLESGRIVESGSERAVRGGKLYPRLMALSPRRDEEAPDRVG